MSVEIINVGGFSIQGSEDGKIDSFETGCVRDSSEGKGRCSLIPPLLFSCLLEVDAEVRAWIEEDGDFINFPIAVHEHVVKWSRTNTGMEEVIYIALQAVNRRIAGSVSKSKIPPRGVIELSKLYEAGALKYDSHNWTKGMKVSRCVDSLYRHLLKWDNGDVDEAHDVSVIWNALAILYYQNYMPEMDDNFWAGK